MNKIVGLMGRQLLGACPLILVVRNGAGPQRRMVIGVRSDVGMAYLRAAC